MYSQGLHTIVYGECFLAFTPDPDNLHVTPYSTLEHADTISMYK